MVPWLGRSIAFPALESALKRPNGLLAAGGSLSADWLLAAYRRGIFPWYGEGDPILWWSPDPRMVLLPPELRVSRSLRKTLRRGGYRVSADSCFADVMRGCAAPRADEAGTWIDEAMIAAYSDLHRRGYAHSIETWIDGTLAGGLYGVAIGRVFFGESMFTRVTDASKIAFVHLVRQLQRWEYGLIDCQMRTSHLASLGGRELPRADFARRLEQLVNYPADPHPWTLDHDLDG